VESLQSFDMDLVVTFTAVFVAGLAAVLGIWMERDQKKPPRYAWALSALILLATFVSLMQSFFDKAEQDKIKDDMARLLTTMDRLASESDDPALAELVKNELNAQSRNDPDVVARVAQRVSDEGRDASEVLGRHLDAAEVEKVTRKGTIKAKATEKVAEAPKTDEAPKRAARATADREDAKETTAAPARPTAERAVPERAAPVVPVPTPTPGTPVETAGAPTPGRAVPARADAKAEPATVEPAKPGVKPVGRKPVAKKPAAKKPRGR